jgi:hypothetical protein
MSPVSRGRRRKRAKHGKGNASGRPSAERRGIGGSSGGGRPSAWTVLESLAGPRERPDWFDSSITGVLDRAGVVLATQGPRELEEATAELLGAELHRIIHEERQGLWLDWWFEQLVEAAAARIRVEIGRDGAWQAPWWLLHGLTSIGPSRCPRRRGPRWAGRGRSCAGTSITHSRSGCACSRGSAPPVRCDRCVMSTAPGSQ